MLDLLFPHRLRRLAYFLRVLPLNALFLGLWNHVIEQPDSSSAHPLAVAGLILLTGYLLFFVYLPRVRDCGLPPYSLVLGLVPYVSSAYSILLLFKRSRLSYFDRPEDKFPAPISIPGNKCAACGRALLLATDGVVTKSGIILCHACDDAQTPAEKQVAP